MTSRRVLSVLMGAALLFGTGGCSWFPEPSADMVADASAYEAEVRALPGVASAEAEVRAVDPKDRPGQFYVSLVVTAVDAQGLSTVPDLVAGVRHPYEWRLDTLLNVPGGAGVAPVTLDDSRDTERAETLRALPIVESVRLSDSADYMQVATEVDLALAVAAIRESGTLTSDPFDSIAMGSDGSRFGVAVSLVGPSDALIDYIEGIRHQVDNLFSSEPNEQFRRPAIRIEASDPAPIAQALALLTGDEHDGRPRTRFDVNSDTDPIRGFVGLPLGSPEPDDMRAADPTPHPVDEAALATQLAADTESVTHFLLAAAEAAGIPGIPAAPDVFAGQCSNPDTLSQLQGTLLLPVFDYVDSADDAYDAITASWEADGYTSSDQAMGTAIYSPITDQPVVQASIRGTSEGIRVTAMTACAG